MKKIILLIIAAITITIADGQVTFNKAKMDSLFSIIEKNDKGMGSLSIFKDGKEIYQRSTGYSDIEKGIKINHDTKFRIGSISKTFTATIIMQMVDEKKILLNTKLKDFFPGIKNSENITIENLLRHHSGIHNFTDTKDYVSWMEHPQTHDDMIKRIEEGGSDFEPGTKASYSNSNFVILSYIAEKIDGKTFPEILDSRIISRCGLQNTAYGRKIETKNNEAKSYVRDTIWKPASETDMSIPSGAGAIISTPTDLNIFMTCLFSGKLVSDSSLSRMETITDGYGIGLQQFPFYEKKTFGHTGGIDGFQSITSFFPDDNVMMSYTSNAIGMSRNDISIGVLSIYFNKDYQLPEFKPVINLKGDDLIPLLGTYSKQDFPIKLRIYAEKDHLFGQGTGQPSFPLMATSKDTFINEAAGISIRFIPSEKKLILKQGGMEFEMIKQD